MLSSKYVCAKKRFIYAAFPLHLLCSPRLSLFQNQVVDFPLHMTPIQCNFRAMKQETAVALHTDIHEKKEGVVVFILNMWLFVTVRR